MATAQRHRTRAPIEPSFDATSAPGFGLPHTSRVTWLLLKFLMVAVDLASIAGSMALALLLCRQLPGQRLWMHPDGLWVAGLSLPLWWAVLARFGLYRTHIIASRIEEFTGIVHAAATSTVAMALVAFAFRLDVARSWLMVTLVLAVIVLTLERKLIREWLLRQRRHGRFLHRTVIVGDNLEALGICKVISDDPYLGYEVIGFVGDSVEPGTCLWADRPVLGPLQDTREIVTRYRASNAMLATTSIDQMLANRLVRELTADGIHVEMSSSLVDIAAGRLNVRPLERYPVLHVEAVRRHGWRAKAKRTLDIVGSLIALSLAAPLLLVSALAIRLDSRGPILFGQERLGRGGQLFLIYKLRTMAVGAEAHLESIRHRNEAQGPIFKIRDDPRITQVGRVLRRYSIDELPQLWNVLRGEMSLVGPRPALASEAKQWPPEVHARIQVKPGITGMWQVRGRSNVSFEEYVRLDLYYVDNWSLWSDLAILAKTIPAVVFKQGAY
jgi:exopolysaccharide biosynthesis polyprenyl glycosylphosphotransferase